MQRHDLGNTGAKTIKTPRARMLALSLSVILLGTAFYASNVRAQSIPVSTQPSTGTIAVPTYEAVGLYWQSPGGTNGCEVKYRKAGDTAWSQGLSMWYDARDAQCRGSLVSLTPNTYYQVEFNLPGQPANRGLVFQTWSNQKPVAKTITVSAASGTTFNVAEGGTASGYVVYDGKGATLDGQNSANYNVTINASYVIVRGLNLKGAKQDAIRISPTVKDVIIEDNDISGWGRTRDGKWGTDMDSGIRAVCSTPTLERVTIQRNKIHDPRYSANSWTDGHPAGPQAITFSYCGGNHVMRHNEAYSTNGNYFNDVFGGEDNFTKGGFPNADSDIYGNRLSHGWDDGIEAEGANENVRIWGNYIDRTATGVATTVTSVGPVYIFRNVFNRNQFYQGAAHDADERQPFFKSGSDASLGDGRRYLFHNTMLQATEAGSQYGLGGGAGVGGTGSTQPINNTFSKNNIYHLWKPSSAMYQVGKNNDFNSDLYSGSPGEAVYTNGMQGVPVYASGNGWQSEAGGMYQLAPSSPGYHKGIRIPNFNDDTATPDVGAHQSGTGAMKFGLAGSAGSAVGGAGTTPPPTQPPTTPPASTGVTMSATTLTFGGTNAAIQNITFTNTTAVSVTFSAPTSSSAKYSLRNGCGIVAAGRSCVVTVTYNASSAAPALANFSMPSTAPNSPHVATFDATTTTTPPPPTSGSVTVSASSLTFTATQVRRTVTYTNNTSTTVQLGNATTSSAKFGQTNNCSSVAPGGRCTATVTYYPRNSGSTSGTFTMTGAPVVNLTAG